MLYYYGGGFTSGSGKNPNTDGTGLASRGDVVVVSVNYRVGSIGFLTFNDGDSQRQLRHLRHGHRASVGVEIHQILRR